jgi:hypothetical protein
MDEAEQKPKEVVYVDFASISGLAIERGEYNQVFLRGTFEYFESGKTQHIATHAIDDSFIERFLGVFRVEKIDDIMDGKNCIVAHDSTKICQIYDGMYSFDVEAWRKEVGLAI